MTPDFKNRMIAAGTDEALKASPLEDGEAARHFVTGLILGYQIGSPGAFGGMAQIPFGEPGGVRTLVREAIELERLATTR